MAAWEKDKLKYAFLAKSTLVVVATIKAHGSQASDPEPEVPLNVVQTPSNTIYMHSLPNIKTVLCAFRLQLYIAKVWIHI